MSHWHQTCLCFFNCFLFCAKPFFVVVHLFTCAYIVWVISPPYPPPLSPPLSFRQVPFCPCHWFCWRKDISIIRKTKRFC
jgi:hypothetical protein